MMNDPNASLTSAQTTFLIDTIKAFCGEVSPTTPLEFMGVGGGGTSGSIDSGGPGGYGYGGSDRGFSDMEQLWSWYEQQFETSVRVL